MDSPQNQKQSRDLPEIENVSRKICQSAPKTIVNDRSATTIPVHQSSHNNLDELLKETTEYLNKNSESKNVSPGIPRIIPIKLEKSPKEPENRLLANGSLSPGETVDDSRKSNEEYVDRKTCLNVTCEFFGSPELENYCSKCYRGRLENLALVDAVSRKWHSIWSLNEELIWITWHFRLIDSKVFLPFLPAFSLKLLKMNHDSAYFRKSLQGLTKSIHSSVLKLTMVIHASRYPCSRTCKCLLSTWPFSKMKRQSNCH